MKLHPLAMKLDLLGSQLHPYVSQLDLQAIKFHPHASQLDFQAIKFDPHASQLDPHADQNPSGGIHPALRPAHQHLDRRQHNFMRPNCTEDRVNELPPRCMHESPKTTTQSP